MKLRHAALAAVCTMVLAACPSPSEEGCGSAPDDVVDLVAQRLDSKGDLRYATARPDQGRWFVSMELHEPDHDEHENGDILTFAAPDESSREFVAVDEKAREHTTFPEADFHIDADGGVESRGCTVIVRDDAEKAAEED